MIKHSKQLVAFCLALVLTQSCITTAYASATQSETLQPLGVISFLMHEPLLEELGIELNYSKERENMPNKIVEAMEQECIWLKETSDGLFKPNYFEITSSVDNREYCYYGGIKKNRPEGFGVLLNYRLTGFAYGNPKTWSTLVYAGNFKNGKYDGFGIYFRNDTDENDYSKTWNKLRSHEVPVEYADIITGYLLASDLAEGMWKGGKYTRKKINIFNASYKSVKETNVIENYGSLQLPSGNYDLTLETFVGKIVRGSLLYNMFVKGKVYSNGALVYNGEMRGGNYHGKGVSYYENCNKKYDGKWKDGKYHGKGTLYDEDGKVIYSGKWKNGDYTS